MRDARHSAVAPQKPKRDRSAHVAALKQADTLEKIKRGYADNPKANARKLRELKVPSHEIRKIHREAMSAKPAPLGGEAISPAKRREDLRLLDKRVKQIQAGGGAALPGFVRKHWKGVLEAQGLGIPVGAIEHPIRFAQKQRNSTSLKKVNKDPVAALPLVAGFGTGGMSIKPAAWNEGGGPNKIPRGGPRNNEDLTNLGKPKPEPKPEPKAKRTRKEMKFPDELPEHVRSAAGRLASQLDKESVKKLRAEQDRLYTEERGKRARVAHAAMNKHAGTEKAIRIAKSKLGGELPKVPVSKVLGDLSADDLNVLRHYIHTHPQMQLFDKINVEDALGKGLSGRPLTEGERLLLHKTFGKEFSTRIEMPSFATRALRVAGDVANLPRSIESSIDVSAPFRQGLVAMARHPGIAAKNFGPMLKALGSEGTHTARTAAIEKRPNYELYRRAKLALTDVGHDVGPREEFYPSALGDKIPGIKQSGRAYTDYLVNTRADMFDRHIDLARKAGYDVSDRHLLESLGQFVNSATGRGDLKALAGSAKVLNATLFSPRLLKSRLDFMNPAYYARLHPYARKEALRSAMQLVALGSAVLEAAHKAGAGVELDPRSSDFGKMRFGDTRIDIWGGFQPIVRTVAQLASGERKTTTTGAIKKLDGKFGNSSRLDVATNFVRGKLAPVPSIGADVLSGSTFVGEPVTPKGEAAQRLIPFGIQDAYDVHHGGHSALETAGAFGLSAVGVGVQNYANDPTKVAKQKHAKLTEALTQEVRKYFHRELPPELRRALKLRERRLTYLAKVKAKDGTFTPLDNFNAHVDLLLKMGRITPAKAKHARAWAAGEHGRVGEHKLSSETTKVVRKYFGGAALEDAGRKLRARGSQFYLGDH